VLVLRLGEVGTMSIIYLFFIAFINSIDNIGIGVAYSIAGVRVQLKKNLLISFMAFAVSYVSSFSGHFISNYISEDLASVISMLLMGFMGFRMVYEAFKGEDKDEDLEKIKTLGYKEALSIGTVLALDDVASSVGSGLVGYGPFMISMPYFVISFIIFFLGNYGTSFFKKLKIGKKANIAAGIIMILLGLAQLLE
jgi:putative Mn2+ efflux pump MntP